MNLLNVPVFSWGISNIWGIYFFLFWWFYFEVVNFVESVWWGREGWPSFQGRFIAVLISSTFHSPRVWYFFFPSETNGRPKKKKEPPVLSKRYFPSKEKRKSVWVLNSLALLQCTFECSDEQRAEGLALGVPEKQPHTAHHWVLAS